MAEAMERHEGLLDAEHALQLADWAAAAARAQGRSVPPGTASRPLPSHLAVHIALRPRASVCSTVQKHFSGMNRGPGRPSVRGF